MAIASSVWWACSWSLYAREFVGLEPLLVLVQGANKQICLDLLLDASDHQHPPPLEILRVLYHLEAETV